MTDEDLATRVERMKAHTRVRDLITQIESLAKRHEKALVEGAARLAERDEARAWADTMLRKIEVLEAQIAAKEQEHQDFRLQNDREWRAKLDHLKAQIAAWEQAAGIYFMIDADKAYKHLLAMNEGKRPR